MSAHVSQNEYLQEAERYARDLFLESPSLSIDEAARQIERECKRSLIKPVISKIRTEVRQRIEAAQRGPSQPMLRKDRADFPKIPFQPIVRHPFPRPVPAASEPFNPPRIVVQEEATTTTEPAPPEDDVMEEEFRSQFKPSSKQERSAYLSDWFMKHPAATITEGRLELQRKFGVAIATADIVETKNLVRQLQEEEKRKTEVAKVEAAKVEVAKPEVPKPNGDGVAQKLMDGVKYPSAGNVISEILEKMRAARIRKIELLSETAYSIEGAM